MNYSWLKIGIAKFGDVVGYSTVGDGESRCWEMKREGRDAARSY